MSFTENDYRKKGFGKDAAWMDLANSEEWDGFGKRTDYLADREWLRCFLHQWRLPHASSLSLQRLAALRAVLRRAAETLGSGGSLGARDLRQLNAILNVPVKERLFQRQNGFSTRLLPVRSGRAWVLSRIAASFAEMMARGEHDRVKICANGGCRWVFFDRTKGRTRQWCNDRTCGNRERVRRARAALKEKRDSSPA